MQALDIAARIRAGDTSAVHFVDAALANIERHNPSTNCFIDITAERARSEAQAIDRLRREGRALPPLAGVPYAVKNLFDVAGLPTLAGSALLRHSRPAAADAVLVARMRNAGAVLVGTLNMDAYAYGFTTENSAFGATRNPHDTSRTAGGSSGGCGAALGAGLVPLSLGSDTNGSIRVPASLCGVFGLKPTYGRLPRTGAYAFADSLDHVGPFATTTADLAACYDALQGSDDGDAACARRPPALIMSTLEMAPRLRVARLGGYFERYASQQASAAVDSAAAALDCTDTVELTDVERARAAAFLITACEGGARHLHMLKTHYAEFEPLSRDRFLAGALTPAAWYIKAQRLRSWFRERVAELFSRYDLLIAPATPVSATPLGAEWIELAGEKMPLRASMGLFTQPVSFIGLPVIAAPIRCAGLPIGVQLIAPPWREDFCFAAAARLEREGAAASRISSC